MFYPGANRLGYSCNNDMLGKRGDGNVVAGKRARWKTRKAWLHDKEIQILMLLKVVLQKQNEVRM